MNLAGINVCSLSYTLRCKTENSRSMKIMDTIVMEVKNLHSRVDMVVWHMSRDSLATYHLRDTLYFYVTAKKL